MNCTDQAPCLMCQLDGINAVPTARNLEPQSSMFESGMAGLGIGFGMYAGIAGVWLLGRGLDWIASIPNVPTAALVAALSFGFLGGAWRRIRV